MGKIGLPLAVEFARNGVKTIGTDINPTVVALVNDSREPFPGEADLGENLAGVIEAGILISRTDTTASVAESDVVVVVVPLLVDSKATPDFRALDAATRDIAAGLQTGTLVCYETTLPVGTTRDRFVPMLEEGSGLEFGKDFHVAFSPERVFSGRIFADLRRYPKLVGGVDTTSGVKAVEFYEQALAFDDRPDLDRANGVWDLGSSEAAEMAKLAETTYRDVNIGLANQFALFAGQRGIDIYAVIQACNSQVFSHIHQPGISVGGHCIPVYPQLYLWNDEDASIVSQARAANEAMPIRSVDLIEQAHGDLTGQRVVVFGLAFRGGVKETAFSGTFPLVAELVARGAEVTVHDPLHSDAELGTYDFVAYQSGDPVDVAVIHTDHSEYRGLTKDDLPEVRTILDGRALTKPEDWIGVKRVVLGVG